MKNLALKTTLTKGLLAIGFMSLLPNASFAMERTYSLDYNPSMYLGAYQNVDLVTELRYRGYNVAPDAVVKRVELLIKARDYRTTVSLQAGYDKSYPTQLYPTPDFHSEYPGSFQQVVLYSPVRSGGGSPGYGDRDGYDRGPGYGDRGPSYSRPSYDRGARTVLQIDGTVKIARMLITVDEVAPPSWTHLEGFKPELGTYSTEYIRVSSYVGRVQRIALAVDKRDIHVRQFIVVLDNGRQIRVGQLEGRVRQKSTLEFEVRRERGVNVSQIIVEAQTLPGQNGRAQVDVSVLHQQDY